MLWGNNFVYLLVVFCIFLMKKEFTCCKFAAFEHFTVCEHPFLLCQHCCCCHIYPAHRSTNSWQLLLLQLYFGTLIFPFQRPNPLSAWASHQSPGFVSPAGISHSACCAECGSPTSVSKRLATAPWSPKWELRFSIFGTSLFLHF